MGYVKVVKNRNYYKRYQVKFRRRRENKTNYRLRRRLIQQDKRKYNTPKWRLVVRITNKDIVAQVACARTNGDRILCAAYAHELKRYGLKVGLTNYPACYCTGLLLARRLLTSLNMDKIYPGKKRIDGNKFISSETNVHWEGRNVRRPFKCVLDVGLHRTTTGARVFGVLKGALDGGLNVPHSTRRFPRAKLDEGVAEHTVKDKYDAEYHRDRIFGVQIAAYMTKLKENDPDRYHRQFSQYIKEGVGPDDLEELYESVHRAIRKDPTRPPKEKKDRTGLKPKRTRPSKISYEQRVEREDAKIGARKAKDADGDAQMKKRGG